MMPIKSSPAKRAGIGEAQRRTTITDVASAAGVSRTTVSYVLSGRVGARVPDATRRRILDAAERVGYRRNALAVALRSGRVGTIGIVSPVSLLTAPPGAYSGVYYKDLVLAIAAAAFKAGLNPLLMSEDSSRSISLADLSDRRVDGVILVVKTNADEFVREAEDAGVPCVTVGRQHGAWQVHTDNALGARLATEHLLALGHRRIAHLWYGKDSVYSARLRRDAYRDALSAAGIEPRPEWVFTDRDRSALAAALRDPDGPTAVFCYNDELGVILLDLCREQGVRVPEEVSVVGFDDNILAVTARPRLTTVRSPLAELAAKAIEMLEAQTRGESPPPEPIFIPPALVAGDSSAPPRAS
jgi:LacI family transcriptional regulator